jgi:hypothetical protein
MPDDYTASDVDIVQAAYAEKVKEAFKVFAENVSMGQNQKNSTERFVRSMQLIRQARDLALGALEGPVIVEPAAPRFERVGEGADGETKAGDGSRLSAEDQRLVDQALAGTTGQKPLQRR